MLSFRKSLWLMFLSFACWKTISPWAVIKNRSMNRSLVKCCAAKTSWWYMNIFRCARFENDFPSNQISMVMKWLHRQGKCDICFGFRTQGLHWDVLDDLLAKQWVIYVRYYATNLDLSSKAKFFSWVLKLSSALGFGLFCFDFLVIFRNHFCQDHGGGLLCLLKTFNHHSCVSFYSQWLCKSGFIYLLPNQ